MGVFEKAVIDDAIISRERVVIPAGEITEFIPQRAPIVMVDEFLGVEGNVSVSRLTVEPDNIFCEEGALSECGVIEHIAQSAALRMGYIYKSQNKEVPLGYIGSVNKFKFYHMPLIGDKLQTKITVEQELMNISLISAVVKIEEIVVAECTMKIFLQE